MAHGMLQPSCDGQLNLTIAPRSEPAEPPHGRTMKPALLARGDPRSEHDPDFAIEPRSQHSLRAARLAAEPARPSESARLAQGQSVFLECEASLSLDHGAATTDIVMHSVTGAFTDPSHEAAFVAQIFRIAIEVTSS